MIVVNCLKLSSRKRRADLRKAFRLNDAPVDKDKVVNLRSANSEEAISLLKKIKPRAVVINGTRIIKKEVFESIPAKFINMHTGITPLYRGVHGAYWALVEGNKRACGVTVYLVDCGTDTGAVLKQAVINPTEKDDFLTYPLLQSAAGVPLLKEAIRDIFNERSKAKPYPEGKSRLWSYLTLWGYLWQRIFCGIR